MNEFVSKIEELMKAKELKLGRTQAFGKYKQFFPEEAVKHPAKCDVNLLEHLILNYTKEGEIILDPMCGTGSTCVLASLFGRHCIGIDIEEKFVKWGLQAKELVEKYETLTPKGKIEILHGDARELSSLLNTADVIVTSPPYSDSKKGKADVEKMVERWDKHLKPEWNSWGKTYNTEGRRRGLEALGSGYGESEANIGNLPYGNIDSIITSPPYSEGIGHGGGKKINIIGEKKLYLHGRTSYSSNDENIGKLPHGNVDSIITSPPYAESINKYAGGPVKVKNVGISTLTARAYSESNKNIGNLKQETYLEAMYKVYQEMYKVLKPKGKAIIIIKPFIKKKKVIDLPYETWLLLEKVGFRLVEVLKFRLEKMSFWRLLYYRKYPHVPVIAHEYILIVEK